MLALPENLSIIGVMKALTPERQALEEAIAVAGGITHLARALNLSSHNVVGQWRRNGVPARHAPDVEALTGVTCERLCPAVNWAVLRNRGRHEQQAAGMRTVAEIQDDLRELQIKKMGLRSELALSQGKRAKAVEWMQLQKRLIAQRSPEQIARMEAAIERAIKGKQ